MKKTVALASTLALALPASAFAEWTPLITASMFDGIRADMLVVVGGILGLALIILGLGLIMRVAGR